MRIVILALMLGGCAGGSVKYVATAKPIVDKLPVICVSKDDKFTDGTARQIERTNLGLQKLRKRNKRCK